MLSLHKTRSFFKTRLPLILGLYILIQPLLDALTAPTANAGIAISVGVVVRTLFMAFAFLYVVFASKFEGKKPVMIYLGAVVAYLILFMVLMLSIGGISLCFANAKELVKVFFVPFVAAFLWSVYREYGHKVPSWSIAWAGGLYAFVIFIAWLTKTSGTSYRSGYGFKGWFYAANEIGCIIAVAAPIMIWFCLKKLPMLTPKTWWKGIIMAIGLFSAIFAANYIGTKIIFIAILVYCVAALIWCLIDLIRFRKRKNAVTSGVMILMIVLMLLLFVSSPLKAYSDNVYGDLMDVPAEDLNDLWELPEEPESPDEPEYKPEPPETARIWLRELIGANSTVEKIDKVLSRRLYSAGYPVQQYIEGSVLNKLLGIGYGNTPAYPYSIISAIELDPVSILVRQGVVGFVLYFVPYLLAVLYLIVEFFKHPLKRLSSLKYCTYLYTSLIAFGISTIAGHVLGAPAVGIFMLVSTMNLFLMTREQNRGLEIDDLT